MGVEGVIGGTLEVLWDGASEENAKEFVALGVGLVLIKGDEDQGLLHEVGVVEQRADPIALPLGGKGDVGVVRVVGHVGGNKGPLGEGVVGQILLEAGEVLDLAQTRAVVGDGVVEDQRIVFADVVVGKGLLVGVVEALETGVRKVFLVLAPSNVLGIEQIGHGRHVGWDLVEVVVVHAKGVTTSFSAVVGFRGMSDGVVVGQEDSLRGQPFLVLIGSSVFIVLVIQLVWVPYEKQEGWTDGRNVQCSRARHGRNGQRQDQGRLRREKQAGQRQQQL